MTLCTITEWNIPRLVRIRTTYSTQKTVISSVMVSTASLLDLRALATANMVPRRIPDWFIWIHHKLALPENHWEGKAAEENFASESAFNIPDSQPPFNGCCLMGGVLRFRPTEHVEKGGVYHQVCDSESVHCAPQMPIQAHARISAGLNLLLTLIPHALLYPRTLCACSAIFRVFCAIIRNGKART